MEKETWQPIPGFSRYEASNYGNIRSLKYKNTCKIRILKPALTSDKYMKTMLLADSGRYRSLTVHRFVALTYHGEKPKGYEINHIDGVKTNNRPDNLEYVTRSENLLHAFKLGLCKPRRGSSNGGSKLNEKQVMEIREYAKGKRHYGRRALAKKYNVSEGHIKDIICRRRNVWPHV